MVNPKRLENQINLSGNADKVLKWNMKSRIEKLDELTVKYPEIIRAREIANYVNWIIDLWSNDKEVDNAFNMLDTLLKQKNDGN